MKKINQKYSKVDIKILQLLSLVLFMSISTLVFSQQEIILTKYTYNSMFFNPAYAGSHGYGEGTAWVHYRNQWLGLEGAPTTIMAGGELSTFDNRLGLGLGIARESIGVESRTEVNLNSAYRIQLNNGYLSGGLRVGFSNFDSDFTKLLIKDATDVFDENNYQYNMFSVGTGLYYHNESLYLGVSVPAIAVISKSDKNLGDRTRHIYGHMGLIIGDEYSSIKVEPSLLLKYEIAAPLQFTLGAIAWFSDDFGIGGHYRSSDALALSAEVQFNDFKVSAAYDFTLSEIRKYSDGTIELLCGYRFNTLKDNPRIKNLRYGGRF
jgi:type IX secretion system PorP/SprF family membrane protein